MLKDFVIALSLANLCFVSGWHMLLFRHTSTYPFYHWKVHPGPLFLAIILDVLLLAVLFWTAMALARRSGKRYVLKVARAAFLLALLIPVFHFIPYIRLGEYPVLLWSVLAGGLVIVGGLVVLIRRGRTLAGIAVRTVLVLSPLVAIWFYQGIVLWLNSPPRGQPMREAERVERSDSGGPASGRVLWLVFDELDFQLGFAERPASVQLPEFDRLRRESLFANNAYPPAGDTVLALPALVTGRFVAKAHRVSHDELMLTLGEGGETTPWSKVPNIFTEAHRAGYGTGLAGWYHPYCRVIGHSLDTCAWETASQGNLRDPETVKLLSSAEERSLGGAMRSLALKALWTVPPAAPFLPSEGELGRRHQIAEFSRLEEQGRRMATDARLGMVMIHLPIPHPIGIYDRSAQTFSLRAQSGYLDNLALADRALGELRRAMEQAGLWDSTTVLVTSDHWLRLERVWRDHHLWKPPVTVGGSDGLPRGDKNHRVPFILKLAGQRTALVYEPPFNSVLSRDLSLAILRGEVAGPEGVAEWLDGHRTVGESPYLEGEK